MRSANFGRGDSYFVHRQTRGAPNEMLKASIAQESRNASAPELAICRLHRPSPTTTTTANASAPLTRTIQYRMQSRYCTVAQAEGDHFLLVRPRPIDTRGRSKRPSIKAWGCDSKQGKRTSPCVLCFLPVCDGLYRAFVRSCVCEPECVGTSPAQFLLPLSNPQ